MEINYDHSEFGALDRRFGSFEWLGYDLAEGSGEEDADDDRGAAAE